MIMEISNLRYCYVSKLPNSTTILIRPTITRDGVYLTHFVVNFYNCVD